MWGRNHIIDDEQQGWSYVKDFLCTDTDDTDFTDDTDITKLNWYYTDYTADTYANTVPRFPVSGINVIVKTSSVKITTVASNFMDIYKNKPPLPTDMFRVLKPRHRWYWRI